jgi:hypothetical protein
MTQSAVPSLIQASLVTPDGARARSGELQRPGSSSPSSAASAQTVDALEIILSASIAALARGDQIEGRLVSGNAPDRRIYLVTDKAVFALEPQAALPPPGPVRLVVTQADRALRAELVPVTPDESKAPPPLPVTLFLVETIATSSPAETDAPVVTDDPFGLAQAVARLLGQSLTRAASPVPPTNSQLAALAALADVDLAVSGRAVLPPALAEADAAALAGTVVQSPALAGRAVPTVQPALPTLQTGSGSAAVDAIAHASAPPIALSTTPHVNASVAIASVESEAHAASALLAGAIVRLTTIDDAPTASVPSAPAAPAQSVLAVLPSTDEGQLLQSPIYAALVRSGHAETVRVLPQQSAGALVVERLHHHAQPEMQAAGPVQQFRLELPQGVELPEPGSLLLLIRAEPEAPFLPEDWPLQLLSLPAAQDPQNQLDALLRGVTAGQPLGSLQSVPQHWPKLDAALPADLLLLINALGRQMRPAPTMARLAAQRYAMPDVSDVQELPVLAALRTLVSSAAENAREPLQSVTLPLSVDGHVMPMVWSFQYNETRARGDGEQHQGQDDRASDFAVQIEFPAIGAVQLRGRATERSLDIMMHTQTPLPDALMESARAVYIHALDAGGMSGRLRFAAFTKAA